MTQGKTMFFKIETFCRKLTNCKVILKVNYFGSLPFKMDDWFIFASCIEFSTF